MNWKVTVLVILSFLVSSCGIPATTSQGAVTAKSKMMQLTGTGSTFVDPLLSVIFSEYYQATSTEVNYQPISSGGGIGQIIAKTVNFGVTDVPFNHVEMVSAVQSGGPVEEMPITLGAEAIVYHLPQVSTPLQLDGQLITDIFLGKIHRWNNASIARLNPDVKLPNLPIRVIYRADASGTTYQFTDYLSHISPVWKSDVGVGKAVSWPVGIGGKGNAGVAMAVRSIPGAISYLEFSFAKSSHLQFSWIKNRSGKFVGPNFSSITAAANQSNIITPENFSIVNAPGRNSYPICAYSWVAFYRIQQSPIIKSELNQMLRWLVTKGQTYARQLGYVPLPKRIRQTDLSLLRGNWE